MEHPELITVEHVASVVGENFTCKASSRGNVQVQIKDLANRKPYTICTLLKDAGEKLHEAGLCDHPDDVVRLSWPTDENDSKGRRIWQPYPQIWVNKPDAATARAVETSEEVKELKGAFEELKEDSAQQMQMLMMLLEKNGIEVPQKPVVTSPETVEEAATDQTEGTDEPPAQQDQEPF